MASIVRLTEGANLALHAMIFLAACPDVPQDTATLAERIGASIAHLSKVLQRLQRAGFVTAVRGPKGGFHLARPAAEISLLSIYETIEGALEVRHCLLDKPVCTPHTCIFGDLFSSANQQFRDLLAKLTLASIASGGAAPGGAATTSGKGGTAGARQRPGTGRR